jgi:hypothetical protein
MPVATELYQTEYSSNLLARYQQSKSRLMDYVGVDDFNGERKDYPRISAVDAPTDISGVARGSATPYRDVDFDKRWVYPVPFEKVSHFAQWDEKFLGTIALPNSPVQQEHVKTFMRQFDDVVIAAARGNVMTGKAGTTAVALPNDQKIAHASTGMTLTKLLATLDILDGADNLDDAQEGDRVFVWTVKQRSQLLNTTEVKSADFNTVKALAEGKIDTFMGFKFKIVKRLPLVNVGTTEAPVMVRFCMAWQRGAVQATRYMKPSSITVRDDLRNALQIYDTGLIGGARLHDEGVVEIACVE